MLAGFVFARHGVFLIRPAERLNDRGGAILAELAALAHPGTDFPREAANVLPGAADAEHVGRLAHGAAALVRQGLAPGHVVIGGRREQLALVFDFLDRPQFVHLLVQGLADLATGEQVGNFPVLCRGLPPHGLQPSHRQPRGFALAGRGRVPTTIQHRAERVATPDGMMLLRVADEQHTAVLLVCYLH